ncbi:MAG: glycosyltransferase [Cyanobacteria bacterium P01_F01_bin.150]
MTAARICMTTLEYPPDIGGVGTSVYRIAHMLQRSGYEVHVTVFSAKFHNTPNPSIRTGYTTNNDDGVLVHRIHCAVRAENWAVQDYMTEVYAQVRSLHLRYDFDAFHAFFLNETGFLATLLAKEYGIPVLNSIRGNDLHKHVFNPKYHGQITWTLEQSDWVTCVSRDLQRRATVLVPTLRPRSSAFWNSIAAVDFEEMPTPGLIKSLWQNADTGLVIGSLGRFRDKKGIEFLLDACALLQDSIPLTLVLIGDFVDKEKAYWDDLLTHHSFRHRVHVTGMMPREDALTFLPHLDIFSIPSIHDGCPNAMLEAMMAGCPIIGTNVDAIGEILTNGEDSLVVPPSSRVELAQAIRQLADSPELRQSLGRQAQINVSQKLSPEVEQDNWVKVYAQVLGHSIAPLRSVHNAIAQPLSQSA